MFRLYNNNIIKSNILKYGQSYIKKEYIFNNLILNSSFMNFSTSNDEKNEKINTNINIKGDPFHINKTNKTPLFRTTPPKKIKVMSWASLLNAGYWIFYEYFIVANNNQPIFGGDWSSNWGLAGMGMSAIFIFLVNFYSRKLVTKIDLSKDYRHLDITTTSFFGKNNDKNNKSLNFLLPLKDIETNEDFSTYITLRDEGNQFYHIIEWENATYFNRDLLIYLVKEKRIPPNLNKTIDHKKKNKKLKNKNKKRRNR